LQGKVGDFLVEFHGEIPRILDGGPLVAISSIIPEVGGKCHCAGSAVFDWTNGVTNPAWRVGLILALICARRRRSIPARSPRLSKEAPELRSIAVLEWTGDAGKPKASRLVPVAVLDGGELQDGGIYMARPQPLALAGEVEYELEQDGKPVGLFDIKNAGQEQGSWVGYGAWKPMPAQSPSRPQGLAKTMDDDEERRAGAASQASRRRCAPRARQQQFRQRRTAPASRARRQPIRTGPRCTKQAAPTAIQAPPPAQLRLPLPIPTSQRCTGTTRATDSDSADRKQQHQQSDDPDRPVLKKTRRRSPRTIGHVDSCPMYRS
jgi:hypothetical protein